MTPEQFVERLKEVLPGLQAAFLYGSAAAGDYVPGASHHDLLLVAKQWSIAELRAIVEVSRPWRLAANPVPQLFTTDELMSSADVFPLEILDLQQSRKVLFGPDLIADLRVDHAHFRLQLERELRSKLLLLRQRCLAAGDDESRTLSALTASLSTFLVLFRAALRLYDNEVPPQKRAALLALAKHVQFDQQPLVALLDFKEQRVRPDASATALAGSYLASIEQVIGEVDRHIRETSEPKDKT
jgi:hypothetical protein